MLKRAYQWYLGIKSPCYRIYVSAICFGIGTFIMVMLAAWSVTKLGFIGYSLGYLMLLSAIVWMCFWTYRMGVDMIAEFKYHWRRTTKEDKL